MNQRELLGVFLMVVVGLALTPALQQGIVTAQYGGLRRQAIVNFNGTTTNVTTLTYGPARNGSATYWNVEMNGTTQTWQVNYTVTGLGTYAGGGSITFATLDPTGLYNGSATYQVRIAASSYALANIISIFWVVLLISVAVLAAIKTFGPQKAQSYRYPFQR